MKDQEKADTSLLLGFRVNELDFLSSKLKSDGIKIITLPAQSEFGYFATILDLEGRKIELTQI